MSIFSSLIDGVDSVIDEVSRLAGISLSDYCALETVDENDEREGREKNVLVASDGTLITLVRLEGFRHMSSASSVFSNVISPLCSSLRTPFEKAGHKIQVVFEVDPDRSRSEIAEAQSGSRKTIKRLGMDLDDLLDSKEEELSYWVSSERCWVVFMTTPATLVASERQEAANMKKAEYKNKIFSKNAQDPLKAYAIMRNRHSGFVETMISEMESCGLSMIRLCARSALREIKSAIDPASTSEEWNPIIPGDKAWPTERTRATERDNWDVLPLPLRWQLADKDAKIVDGRFLELGDRIYAPMYLEVFPREWVFANEFFERARSKKLPWRASFLIEGNGLSGMGFRKLIAQILTFTQNTDNKLIVSAIKELQQLQDTGGQILKMQACFTTWAKRGQLETIISRASELTRTLQVWGSCSVAETTGNPLPGFACTIPGYTVESIGTPAAPPITDGLSLLPFSRPSSPWSKGALLLRTPDGKLMPVEPYSSKQATWISLIFAPPGAGKSVLMNAMNLALCLSSGKVRLPRIAILDVGYSSAGFVSLIQEALPQNQKHLAIHRTMIMSEKYSINPFDTQLGCRMPTAMHRQFVVNFLTLLATEYSKADPSDGMADLAAAVVDQMYKQRMDGAEPNKYVAGYVPEADEWIAKNKVSIDHRTSWWEVVDHLIRGKQFEFANRAQKYAVPLLSEAIEASRSERIRNQFEKIHVSGTGEPLIDSFARLITSSLRMIPVLSRPTAMDLGNARIVALDLDQIVKSGGPVGDRITALMYMLARQITAGDFYLKKESVDDMPAPPSVPLPESVPVDEIKAYHLKRIEEIFEDQKRICYDEFHRTKGAERVRTQVETDMREGRKFNVDIILASQELSDFSKTMVNLQTSTYIMAGGTPTVREEIEERFGFSSDAEKRALENDVHSPRPGSGGGTFLAKFVTNEQTKPHSLLLKATLSPIEIWAFNTSAKDVALRNRLYDRIGATNARRILANRFPDGSARKYVERVESKLGGGGDDQKIQESVYDTVAKELIEYGRANGLIR